MRIVPVVSLPNESKVKIHLDSGQSIELWLQASVEVSRSLDCWLFLMLPICMALGEDLEIEGTIAASALVSFHNSQRELLLEHPNLNQISIKHQALSDAYLPSASRVGSFFSGGLDSTYTAETEPEIDTFVIVWGFDIPHTNEKHWKLTSDLIATQASQMGKEQILVKTNIRDLSNGILQWGRDYHGTALAGVANLLSNHLKKVHISPSHSVETKRWGQFPSLAKAFSTDYQQLEEHRGLVRSEKAAAVGNKPRSVNIRVCYRNVSGTVNCGTCIKCVRTRLEFDLVKAKHRPVGLDTKASFTELLKVKYERNDYVFFLDSINWARNNGFKQTLIPRIAAGLARLNSVRFYGHIKPPE